MEHRHPRTPIIATLVVLIAVIAFLFWWQTRQPDTVSVPTTTETIKSEPNPSPSARL